MREPPLPATTFAQLAGRLTELPAFDNAAAEAARTRQQSLTKPPGSLGRLEEIAIFLAGWQSRPMPSLEHVQALVFAGNHGVCRQGVNVYPQSVTAQMVANFQNGGAAINQLCAVSGARLEVFALDLDRPTNDLTTADAMTERETLDALSRGFAAVDPNADALILGEMGIGNSTVAAALALALFGGGASQWVGPGTGADGKGISLKAGVIEGAFRRIEEGRRTSPLEVLAAVGGREQAALCGAILAARRNRVPVLLDGFICTASAAVLHVLGQRLSPAQDLLAHCIAGHVGAEPGHRPLLQRIGKRPLLDLDMRLGEGSGAAVALLVAKAAVAAHTGMATFAEAGVNGT